MKICTKCGKEKSLKEFYKCRTNKDGLHFWCRTCMRECDKEYYEENKEKIKEDVKQYHEKNKEKMKKYHKQRYEENKDKISEQCKQWRKEKVKYDTYTHQIDWCEEVRRDPDNKDLLQVRCTESSCRKWFNPTNKEIQHRISSLKGYGSGESRFYCSEKCKQICSLYQQKKYPKGQKPYYGRPEQGDWAKMVKERDDYECQICGSKDDLVAHHFEGIYVNLLMSCDLEMGITLCDKCDRKAHSDVGCRSTDLTRRSLCKK